MPVERLDFDPIKSPSYSLSKFTYAFKLNQMVKAASLTKKTFYVKKTKEHKRIDVKIIQNIEKEIVIVPNRPCYKPILAIRKWKIWIRFSNQYGVKSKCNICRYFQSFFASEYKIHKEYLMESAKRAQGLEYIPPSIKK